MRVVIHEAGGGQRAFKTFNAEWTHKLKGPGWSSATVHLDHLMPWQQPMSHDWMTIEHEPGALDFVGRVDQSPWQVHRAEDHLVVEPMRITAKGYMDTDIDVVVSTARQQRLGTIFPTQNWVDDVARRYIDTVGGEALGRAMESFVLALFDCTVPATLLDGGPQLGQAMYVVWDDTTAAQLGLRGSCEPVQGFSIAGIRSILRQSRKVGQLITGTFQPNAQLIELHPVLVRYTGPRAKAPKLVNGSHVMAVRLRMAPFRVRGLKDVQRSGAQFQTIGRAGPYNRSHFDQVTWDSATARVCRSFTMLGGTTSSALDVNAASAWLSTLSGGDELKVSELLGMPIVRDPSGSQVIRDGLRHSSTIWPFLPPLGMQDGVVDDDYLDFTQRLAMTHFQFESPGAYFHSGTAKLSAFDPSWQPGTIVAFPLGSARLTAYLTEVSHNVMSDDTSGVSGTTTLTFERGLWDERLRDPAIDVPALAVAPTKTSTPASYQCTGLPGVFPRNADQFSQYPPILDTGPTQLAYWAATKGFSEDALHARVSPSRLYPGDTPAKVQELSFAAAIAAYIIERYWRQWYPRANITVGEFSDSGLPYVAGHFRSVRPGTNPGNHGDGSAFDFVIDRNDGTGKVPSLQSWAALFKLAKAGRIPNGARGLYLNTHPQNGIQGTTLQQAGAPSSVVNTLGVPNTSLMPGGSGGTHYDLRGAFGARNVLNTQGTFWVACDNNGDGSDEYRSGGTGEFDGRTQLLSLSQVLTLGVLDTAVRAELRAYINAKGADDPALPPVGDTVPNILQVAGFLTDKCFKENFGNGE